MSQYGNSSKNPPWARSGQNMNQQNAVPQPLMGGTGMMQYPQVFQGQQAMGMSMPGLPQGPVNPMQAAMQASNHQMYGTVSYPTRALNTAAFQGHQQQNSGSQSGKQNRVFTGTVTKVQDNFGFVDDDVFFQSSCCVKGSTPQVGDRVLVEAVYNANMPYKWNATRIQVLSTQEGGGQRSGGSYGGGRSHQSNYNSVPPPRHSGSPAPNRFSSGGGSRFSSSSNERSNRGGGSGRDSRRDEPENRKRRRDDRDKDEKVKSPPRKRSRSPVKAARRPRRAPPRYNVNVPRTSLNGRDGDVVEIKKRYTNMYIPSDFFLSEYRWTDTFPIGKPISLDFPCAFHIFHKDVDPLEENDAVLEPADADYIYSAKVMLLASPGLEELYNKCTIATEERENSKSTVDEDSLSHPSRMIQFLVGTRGKENMAIGGPWSPSEDGADPSGDPSVLVRTAIRTTKALTGIDLSGCTQWFRFVEVHYYRSETAYRGKSYPARVETVVIFVPDVWSCVPTRLEWDELQVSYQKALAAKLNDEDNDQKEEDEETPEKESTDSQSADKVKGDPTHYSELDPKNMKVTELREELEARNLSSKGLKSQLAARLSKALKTEEEEEQSKKTGSEESAVKKKEEPVEKEKKETDEKKKKEDEEKKKIDERERQQWEKRYKLPKKPHLCVHPSRTAKSGKFDCSVQSLTSLLGYRQDDTKEHSFEVSIFAELFNEMLMRDFGFNIYRAIAEAPEKSKEEKEKEKSKDDKDKSKDDKEKDRSKEDKDKEKGKDDDKDKEQKKEAKSKEKDDKDSEQKSEDMDAQSDGEDQNEDGKERSLKDENVSKDNDSKDKKGDKDSRKERARMITYDRLLLLSFTFFDISRCGYIYDKDIEDLLFSLGLTLSRSQVRKLLSKVVSRDAVYYRRLTDKPEGSPAVEHMSLDQLVGNKLILPSFLANQKEVAPKQSGDASEVQKGQLITFNGTIIDISKVMDQLTRSETTRHETERALGKLRDEFSKLKETTTKSEKYIKELRDDLRDYRERLSVSNSELSSLQAKEKHFVRTLSEISDKIKPLIAKPEPKHPPPPPQETPKTKEVIDLVDEKGEEPMAVDEDK